MSYTLYFKPTCWSLQMASWENWQQMGKGENPFQRELCSAQSRKEGKFLRCRFLSKFKLLWIWFGESTGCWTFYLSGSGVCFLLVYLELNPETLVWLSACLGHTDCQFSGMQGAQQSDWRCKTIARQKRGLHSLLAMVCSWLLPSVRGIVWVFVLLIFGSGSGFGESSILRTLFGNTCCIPPVAVVSFNTAFTGWNLTRYLKGFFFF